jgi:hypothetical protein
MCSALWGKQLFEHPTIAALATAIQALEGDLSFASSDAPVPPPRPSMWAATHGYKYGGRGRADSVSADPAVNWAHECTLDPAIGPGGKPSAFTPTPSHIFLTGGTGPARRRRLDALVGGWVLTRVGRAGYLGAFLLRRLLDVFPQVVVHCHVRASDEDAGRARLVRALQDHLLWYAHGARCLRTPTLTAVECCAPTRQGRAPRAAHTSGSGRPGQAAARALGR